MFRDELRLTSREMARFVAHGYLRFDSIVPAELCQAAMDDFGSDALRHSQYRMRPLTEVWPAQSAIAKVFTLPRVRAIIESLVGPNPTYDHHAVHIVDAHSQHAENVHQDAEYDVRFEHFDIQISFFPHEVTPDMGGTLFLPSSHFRRAHVFKLMRYQSIVGQLQTVCPAGTLVFWHHNLWHGARSNFTDRWRYMFKLRLNASVKQERLWNTEDEHDPEVVKALQASFPWHGHEERREVMNRIRLWRALTGNDRFDIANWWGRVENQPEEMAMLAAHGLFRSTAILSPPSSPAPPPAPAASAGVR